MKPVLAALSPSPAQAQAVFKWAMVLFVLPLGLFIAVALWQAPRTSEVRAVADVALWQEPLGPQVFDQPTLQALASSAPDGSQARWEPVTLPHSIELGAAIDLPLDAPKQRAWFRLQVPPELAATVPSRGRLGLMGNRVMGGPWSVWADGQLVQANLANWRMQWNTPLRVMLPLNAREVMVAVPYAQAQGYAMGSLFMGPVDAIDQAWQLRNFWQADAPRAASIVALLLLVMSLPLAFGRRKEPVFALLGANALLWSIVNLQYFHDFTGQDQLSAWFGAAMDVSINWVIVLNLLFAYEFERLPLARLRVALLLYACASTLITLPLWNWEQNALLAQHYANVLVYLGGTGVLAWHVLRKPTREGVALLLALVAQFGLGLHGLLALTSQAYPDHIHAFPFGVVTMFLVFMYAISRRTVKALAGAERHQADLQAQLDKQKERLATQYAEVQRLEIENRLATQREALLQDLHDGLGSNLTSALLQARGGTLSGDSTLLLLQDLADELRYLSQSAVSSARSLNDLLAELRQRIQNRLTHGGIQLVWAVAPKLPEIHRTSAGADQHLRALLGEAIANIIKHARATRIRLSAGVLDGAVVIEVVDNGQGFLPAEVELGRGLPGMRQRAQALGARLSIDALPGQGCRWRLSLPLAPGAAKIYAMDPALAHHRPAPAGAPATADIARSPSG